MSEQSPFLKLQKSAPSFTPAPSGILQRKCACGNHTVAGGECAECGKEKSGLQRKLTIGASNDPLEQEADRVADQVMAAPTHSSVSGAPPRIQRYAGQATSDVEWAPSSVDRVLASAGRPMEPPLRQDMELRFGHDFSRVRVHSGEAGEQSARQVNANAYTVGHNIVFGTGRFMPGTHEGRRLIAHELTHVVQQSGSASIVANSTNGNSGQLNVVNHRIEPHVIRRQPAPPSLTKQEQQDKQLRLLARLPRKALEQWMKLKVNERDTILQEMTRYYGPDFTNDFTEYAFRIKKPDFSGAVIQSTAKELTAKGYRSAGNVWVHPSGREAFLISPPRQTSFPPDNADDRDIEVKCVEPCTKTTEDKDKCEECCTQIPPEYGKCRSACEKACAILYAE